MLKPTVGQKVTITAYTLKEGMIIHRNGEALLVCEVEIDLAEKYPVSVIYQDHNGDLWSTYYHIPQAVIVEYAKGQNLVDIL